MGISMDRTACSVVALSGLLLASSALADRLGPPSPPEERRPLSRVREGGTPYDPNQPLTPYALASPLAASPESGVIASPAEYEPVRGVLFRYSTTAWPSVVRALVQGLTGDSATDEIAYVVVASQSAANSAAGAFASDGSDLSRVVFLIHPTNSIWMRDYGPHFIWQDGTLAIVDSHYYPGRGADNFIPTLVAQGHFEVPAFDIPLYFSGGNFMAGPDRSAFVTALVNLDNPSSQGFTTDLIAEFHTRFQGIDTLHVLPQLPPSVDGTGHIDMWMYLVDERTAIVSQFLPGSNATAISVTDNAVPYLQNLGFTVHRPPAWNAGGTHYTYTNAFRVNDRIFVPVYGNALVPGGSSAYNARDTEAMAAWQAAVEPGVELIPIQCSSIITASGAIHCIVKQVPRYASSIPAAHVRSPAAGALWLSGSVETIRWNATDLDNRALASVDLAYSLDGGDSWETIATGLPDSGAYEWLVPEGSSGNAMVRATVRSTSGAEIAAMSNPFEVRPGTAVVYDFSQQAGTTRFAFGHQSSTWSVVAGSPTPVSTPLTASNYAALATSNATGGGTSSSSRFNSPSVSSGFEATHLFTVRLDEDPASIDELTVRWEGFAERCTQMELYLWDVIRGRWGDGEGVTGQNRFADSYAGNLDANLETVLRGDLARVIDAEGTLRVMLRAQREGDRSLHDYFSVTVKRIEACPGDFDGNGIVDGGDLAAVLASWGECGDCPADLDGNGVVDGSDLGAVLGAWGACR
jgi:agmatine deiminase